LATHLMDMLFTHFGLSGHPVLRCSQYVVKEMKKNGGQPVEMRINSMPDENAESAFQLLFKMMKEDPKKSVKNVWKSLAQERWLLVLLQRAGIDPALTGAELASDKVRAMATQLTAFAIFVNGTQPIEKAFVT